MALPLARNQVNTGRRTPDGEAVRRILELVETNPDAFAYFNEQAQRSGVLAPELQEMVNNIAKVAWQTRNKFAEGDLMGGTEPPTPFIALQEAYADIAVSENLHTFSEQNARIVLSYQVTDDGAMRRGYAVNGKSLNDNNSDDAVAIDKLDTMVKAWLAKQDIFYHEGKLYAANANGEMKKDSKGNHIPISSKQFDALIRDEKNGFARYMNDNGFNASVNLPRTTIPRTQAAASSASTNVATEAQEQRAAKEATALQEKQGPSQDVEKEAQERVSEGQKGNLEDAEGVEPEAPETGPSSETESSPQTR